MLLQFLGRFGQIVWLTSSYWHHHDTFFWQMRVLFFHCSDLNATCPTGAILRLVGICGIQGFKGEWSDPFIVWQSSPVSPLSIYFFSCMSSRGRLAYSPDVPQMANIGTKSCFYILHGQGKIGKVTYKPSFHEQNSLF